MLLGTLLALVACAATTTQPTAAQPSIVAEQASQAPAAAVICAPEPRPFTPNDINLTGAWAGDDGGIYYVRDLGSVVWWSGMSEREGSPLDLGRFWNNVARGEINGLQVDVQWADVPRGHDTGQGTLTLRIQDDGTGNIQIVTEGDTGDFGNHIWTPCAPVELQVADYLRDYGGDVGEYANILTSDSCDDLAEVKDTVTTSMNTAEAGSPEFRAALGYSNAINERQTALNC